LNNFSYGEKSKLIGIFQGKKKEYNELILKSLLSGPKITKQIAEYVYSNRKERSITERRGNEVKKIISTISKKDSRLEELKNKNYIFQEDGLYKLTIKGKAVALTLVDSVYDVMPYIIEEHKNSIPEALQLIKANPFLKRLLRQEMLREIVHIASTPEHYQRMKDITNHLITVGVNLDDMSDLEFQNILGAELFSSLIRKRSLKGTRFNKLRDVLFEDLKHYEKELKN
jgi:hypothetical protein